ncbi:AAA family ATPase [Salinactinospora qingdaonensis]|uniref:Uncharacterized protein n=1 Tax=Salinactinospora qingdaonensis TaxID=702744 RepID=A0ABP7GGE7_9ACTN
MGAHTDIELLRAYEPVLSYTKGELFFPTDVEGYLACCSLWLDLPDGKEAEVVPAGELTVERLAGAAQEWSGQDQHLRFVQESSLRAEARRHQRTTRRVIPKSGRLAAVGVLGRVVDVLMKLSLLIRGAVPGGAAAAAATRYRDRLDTGGATYYGRVLRDGGYVILQYWYFYVMNDWRSTYGGVNDHEADWETVTVYLVETPDGGLQPAWVGASSHEYTGDDLRRSWDDPELHREGDHPVVFVGAGSHSHQMLPGDYLIQVDPAGLTRLVRAWRRLTKRLLPSTSPIVRHGIGVPFVDYARGDGVRVGPGGDREWTPVLIDDTTPWVRGFRGLWGRDTRDWFNGERAPSGPRYERDGTVRWSWADPLSWVGLHKTSPNDAVAREELRGHLADLEAKLTELDAEITRRRDELRRLSVARTVLSRRAYTQARARDYAPQIQQAERELAEICHERAVTADESDIHRAALERRETLREEPQAHLRSPHRPYAAAGHRPTRFLHVWAALSTPLLIVALGALLFLRSTLVLPAVLGVVVLFAAVDAFARRKFASFLAGGAIIVVVAAVIAGIIAAFLWDWRITLLVPMVFMVGVLLVVNVRDLLRR